MPDDETRLVDGKMLLGARLRDVRTKKNLSLPDLAERAGISKARLSDLERGRSLPSLPTLDTLAAALGTTAAALLRGVYPWGSTEAPTAPPTAPPDGRAGRRIPSRRKPSAT